MWIHHPKYPGYLEVHSSGMVRSVDRISPKGRRLKGKILKPSVTRDGHLRVGVTPELRTYHRYVHVLVLEAFIGERPSPAHDARHINGLPSDNRLENLAWGTKRENRLDDIRNGVNSQMNRTHCPRGHEHSTWNNAKSKYVLGNGTGVRMCRACNSAWSYARRKGLEFSEDIANEYYLKYREEALRAEGNQLE